MQLNCLSKKSFNKKSKEGKKKQKDKKKDEPKSETFMILRQKKLKA